MALSASVASIPRQGMFAAPIMSGIAYITSRVPGLVAVEVEKGPLPAVRKRPNVAMMRVIAIIDVAVKVLSPVIPGTGADEVIAYKPIGPIVAVGGTVVWGKVEVSVRAHRCRADVDAE